MISQEVYALIIKEIRLELFPQRQLASPYFIMSGDLGQFNLEKTDYDALQDDLNSSDNDVEQLSKALAASVNSKEQREEDIRKKEEPTSPNNQFFGESGRLIIFERKGIKTDLLAIERYVNEIQHNVQGIPFYLIVPRSRRKSVLAGTL
jgi:hypothetical protein